MSHPSRAATAHAPKRRFMLTAGAALLAAAAVPAAAHRASARVELALIDRDSGQALNTYRWRDRTYVAGRPGARYALRISNRSAERVMVVMAVDGVNIITGQTADWNQSGYVLAPWQSYAITGWRKSDVEVAAFEFTALPDSYAARTGRPLDVGVIGVAVFTERAARPRPAAPTLGQSSDAGSAAERSARQGASGNDTASGDAAMAKSEKRTQAAADAANPAAERLGTGHGEREHSVVTSTHFVRDSIAPVQLLAIHYDRMENLVRAGVIQPPALASPRAFPKADASVGYVTDPPPR